MNGADYTGKLDVLESGPRRIGRETLAISVVCLVVAIVLRFVALGRRDLFGDEYFTLDYLTKDRPNLFHEIFRGHLPLYYELLRAWSKLVGTSSDWLLRFPSAVFSVAACVAFFFLAFRFLRGLAFVLCLVAFALNPILVRSANEATPYALLSLLVVLVHYYGVRALDEGQRRHWLSWGIVGALGAMTHPFFWFVLLAQFLFAIVRPKKTPRPFVVASAAGVFVIAALLLFGAIYANKHFATDVTTPSVADLARGLVGVTLGEFWRYSLGDRVFVRAVLYLFVLVALSLSWVYYRLRVAEAQALPENVVWIDETQDVVGQWNRLSLASFLLYLWMVFGVPAIALMIVGGFASGRTLPVESYVVCLPPMLVLIACGIDAAPGRTGTVALGLLFVLIMTAYNFADLGDDGYGIKQAVRRIRKAEFHSDRDALLVVSPGGLEGALARYASGLPYSSVRPPGQPDVCEKVLEEKTRGRERVMVLYHDDFRRIGKSERSLVREWFGLRKDKWDTDKKWVLSTPERTELRIYVRIDPNKTPPRVD